jgi:hypothetical protein
MRIHSPRSDRAVVLRWEANFVHGLCEDITEALCTSSELQRNAYGSVYREIVYRSTALGVGHSENNSWITTPRVLSEESAPATLPPSDSGTKVALVVSCQRC